MNYKKRIIICSLIVGIAFLPFLETAFRSHACEPILNIGGPNKPYCVTMVFMVFLIPGFIISSMCGIFMESILFVITSGFFSFIFYLLMYALFSWIYKKRKYNLKKSY